MKPGIFQQLILYRYRYVVGYTLLVLFGVSMLVWQLSTLGPGLADAEKTSAIKSATWQWQQWQSMGLEVINLPYVILQKVSIALFGLSSLSVRLPSVLIGLLGSGLFFCLMRRLHRSHIALAASVLFVSCSWYIAIARFGTPLVMIPFVWILLTYSFVRLIRLDNPGLGWAALGGLAGALALYTPYGIYPILAALLVIAIHPEIRRNFSAITGQQIVLALFVIVPLLVPWGWGIYKHPMQLWELVALSKDIPNPLDFLGRIGDVFMALAIHTPTMPDLRLTSLPLLNVGLLALSVAGVVRAVLDWRSMRTQFIVVSFTLLLLVTGFTAHSKDYAPFIVPVFLLAASGVSVLFHEWYKLFPRNPYARSFGLIPVVILLSFIVVYHYQQYFVAWAQAPQTYQVYDNDLSLVRQQISAHPTMNLRVPKEQEPLYSVLLRKYPQASLNPAPLPAGKPLMMEATLGKPVNSQKQTIQPIVNDDSTNALRFWLVQ